MPILDQMRQLDQFTESEKAIIHFLLEKGQDMYF